MTRRERDNRTGGWDDLEQLLAGQLADYRALLRCVERKRQAVRTADVQAVDGLCRQEAVVIQRLRAREEKRLALVIRLGGDQASREEPPTLLQLAQHLDDPRRNRLLALADELRESAARLRREHSVVRSASESLSQHLNGLMQSMQSALSRAGIYGRRGHVAAGAQLQFKVDLKS